MFHGHSHDGPGGGHNHSHSHNAGSSSNLGFGDDEDDNVGRRMNPKGRWDLVFTSENWLTIWTIIKFYTKINILK